MITNYDEGRALVVEYNAIRTDKERLAFLKSHNQEMKVVLDNDQTMVELILPDERDPRFDDLDIDMFDNYHGWTDGVVELFEFAGITAETC